MKRILMAAFIVAVPLAASAEEFEVDPEVGNSTFTATFDAPFGERITALGSQVGCALTFDESGTASGGRRVPLLAIRVDNEDTKTDHFRQWTTNKKMDAKDCWLEAKFIGVRPAEPLQANQPVPGRSLMIR